MRRSLAALLSAALIAAGTGSAHASSTAPVGENGQVRALPSANCIFDRWGNLKVSGSGACRLDASKQTACTKAKGVVSAVNGALICTSRAPGNR